MAKKPTQLDETIDECLSELRGFDAHSEDYAKIVDQLSKLYALKAADKPAGVCKDTLAVIAGNIAVALIVVNYEHAHVLTSRALSFLLKARI